MVRRAARGEQIHAPRRMRLACSRPRRQYLPFMFQLTRQERLLVLFVLFAFLTGLGLKQWRGTREAAAAVASLPER